MRRVVLALLAVLLLLPLSMPASGDGERLGKPDLLTLDQAASVYDDLLVESFRDVSSYGLSAPGFSASPLVCDGYRQIRGSSRVAAYYYTVKGPGFALSEDLVRFDTGREARALVQRYRDYASICRGTYDTDDGEGGYAQQRVRAWRPRSVGVERAGVLEAFIQEGSIAWRRTLVARVGRTVVVLTAEPRRGTGRARELTKATRLAVAQLR